MIGAGLLLGGGTRPTSLDAPAQTEVPAETGANTWTVIPEDSALTFSGVHEGRPYRGRAEVWRADIVFSPDDLAGSSVTVEVDAGNVRTGDAFYDASIREGDWLAVSRHPTILFVSTGFEASDGGYVATGDLTLKGETRPVSFPFTLTIDGDRAQMTGELPLSRLDWGIGVASDAGADWVADEIRLGFSVAATR